LSCQGFLDTCGPLRFSGSGQLADLALDLVKDAGLRFVFDLGPAPGGEALVLLLRDCVCLFPADSAGVWQDGALVKPQEIVEPGPPIVQEDLLAPQGLIFGEIEEHDYDPIQLDDLAFAQ
jgi:hypothetical protein